ncbi:hypothetical protein Mycsm_02015 [Mycobacterium sp. JS623]|jgi:hypothetical protein|nr:hypothetical protein Mycsm_02015 [Mycobacterium sp. JS623]
MPDLGDEPTPVVVYNVPGIGAAQLCNAKHVDGSACIHLRADIGYPLTVTSDECPHGYTNRKSWAEPDPAK